MKSAKDKTKPNQKKKPKHIGFLMIKELRKQQI